MATPMMCDNDAHAVGDLVITNQHTGDVTVVCMSCFPSFAMPLIEAIMDAEVAAVPLIGEPESRDGSEAVPAETPAAPPSVEPAAEPPPAGGDHPAEAREPQPTPEH